MCTSTRIGVCSVTASGLQKQACPSWANLFCGCRSRSSLRRGSFCRCRRRSAYRLLRCRISCVSRRSRGCSSFGFDHLGCGEGNRLGWSLCRSRGLCYSRRCGNHRLLRGGNSSRSGRRNRCNGCFRSRGADYRSCCWNGSLRFGAGSLHLRGLNGRGGVAFG